MSCRHAVRTPDALGVWAVMSGESVPTSPTHGWSVSMMVKQGTEAEDTKRLSPNGSLTQRTKVQLEGSLDVGDPALRVDIIGFDLPRSLYFLLWTSTRVLTPFLRSRTTSTGGKQLRNSIPTFLTYLYIV